MVLGTIRFGIFGSVYGMQEWFFAIIRYRALDARLFLAVFATCRFFLLLMVGVATLTYLLFLAPVTHTEILSLYLDQWGCRAIFCVMAHCRKT
jgi:hypothetical protein